MDIRFWGTRGSVATPGPETVRYGGNTSCVEVSTSETVAIFDCGTGARPLGASLASRGLKRGTHMFLTHVHWDHIQGFPFFLPILVPGTELDVYGAAALEQGLEEAMAGQMQYTYFPLRLGELRSRISFHQVPEGSFAVGQFTVKTQYLNHTCPTMGYRLYAGNHSVAYITDHEPYWPHNPDLSLSLDDALVHPGDRRHVGFVTGADLLIHDAQYTSEEYPAKRGWGHGTWEYVVDVAVAAGVRQLGLFHHDPVRDDDAVDRIVEQARERVRARGSDLVVFAAAERQIVEIGDIDAAPPTVQTTVDQATPPPARITLLGPPEPRRMLREALVEDGYPLVEAAFDTLPSVAGQGSPDLVVVSLTDPSNIDESLRIATEVAQGRPILAVLEGDVTDALIRHAAEFADDVIVAPLGPPNLRARVRALLARRSVSEASPVVERQTQPESLQVVDRLSGAELEAMLGMGSACAFRPGEILFRQGDRSTGVYYVHSGLIRLIVHAADGRELTVGFAGAGDTVGEMGALDGSPRSATAVMLEEVDASYISRDVFIRALERAPRAAVRLLRLMTQRLRDMDRRLITMAESQHPRADAGESEIVEDLRSSVQRLSSLLDLSRALVSELDSARLLETVIHRTMVILDVERAALFLVNEADDVLRASIQEDEKVVVADFPRDTGLTGQAAITGRTINLDNAADDPRFDARIDQQPGVPTRTFLCAPVRDLTGRVIAVLQGINRKKGAFTQSDEDLLAALSTQVAVALENAALMETRQKESEKSVLLLDVMRSLSTELELDQLLARIMDKTTEVMHADRSSLFLVDYATNELWFKVAQGGAELREVRIPMGVGIAGHVAATGETLNIHDAYEDPRFSQTFDRQTGYRTKTILCMPIRNSEGRIVGVLQVLNKKEGVFTSEDEALLDAVGSQAAIALQNASLFEEVVRVKNYNESILNSMATGVVALDMDGRIQAGNPAAERILSFPDGLPRGLTFDDAIRQSDNQELSDLTRHALTLGSAKQATKLRYFPGGAKSPVTMNVSAVPLLDRKGDQSGVVLVIEDISREQQLVGTLSRVVSRQVAEQLIESGGMPVTGGQRKQVTVLMSDIRNFTTMSEASDPEEIVLLLNDYFGRMIDVVFSHEGTLDKFIGDGIMAVFGTPIAHDDDPLRAVKAAVDMRRGLREFNAARIAAGKMTIEIGIGICTGEAISGTIGSEERMDFTVIGDTVNTAARLEGLTKLFPEHKIVFSESVEQEIRTQMPCDFLAEETVKGKTQSIRVFGISDAYVYPGAPGPLGEGSLGRSPAAAH